MYIDRIVVHCSDSPHGRGDGAEDIHYWHKQRGWSGIGYHYVIKEDGRIENGRPQYWEGAHVRGHNANTLGICLIGKDEFTPDQFDSLRGLLDRLRVEHPSAVIVGHRDLDSSKTCPNFDVQHWYKG